MTSGFQPFLISEFKAGIQTYLQPWVRSRDAFSPLVNAYVYRGVVQKRTGYSPFGFPIADGLPVMGLMRYINQADSTNELLAATTRNLYLFNEGTLNYDLLTLPSTPAQFNGTIANFFNYTNWQTLVGTPSYLIMTNNVDPVTFYNGAIAVPGGATQPDLWIQPVPTLPTPPTARRKIGTCLDVKIYKERLLFIRPTIVQADGTVIGTENQSIYWSQVSNPFLTIPGSSGGAPGFLAAPTGDAIQATEFLRDQLVVFFTNSTWIFRYTGNYTTPFRWDKINNSKSTTAPYASIDYDEKCTSVGNTGLIASDGVNVQRYDIPIVDYYETQFSQTYFAQTFAQRYDNLSQGWMLYVSNSSPFDPVDNIAPGSDKALIYNFIEETWATYSWPVPMTCLGTFFSDIGLTWAALMQPWEDTPQAWNAYQAQKGTLLLLAGDVNGNVYQMDQGTSLTDNGTPIIPEVVSAKWNPVIQMGSKTQFGHIDIYYTLPVSSDQPPVSLTLNFYLDNNKGVATTRTLTMDSSGPSTGSTSNFKRIYINLVGEFVRMEIKESLLSSNVNPFFKFLGFILWARPAGRLTSGLTLS